MIVTFHGPLAVSRAKELYQSLDDMAGRHLDGASVLLWGYRPHPVGASGIDYTAAERVLRQNVENLSGDSEGNHQSHLRIDADGSVTLTKFVATDGMVAYWPHGSRKLYPKINLKAFERRNQMLAHLMAGETSESASIAAVSG